MSISSSPLPTGEIIGRRKGPLGVALHGLKEGRRVKVKLFFLLCECNFFFLFVRLFIVCFFVVQGQACFSFISRFWDLHKDILSLVSCSLLFL